MAGGSEVTKLPPFTNIFTTLSQKSGRWVPVHGIWVLVPKRKFLDPRAGNPLFNMGYRTQPLVPVPRDLEFFSDFSLTRELETWVSSLGSGTQQGVPVPNGNLKVSDLKL